MKFCDQCVAYSNLIQYNPKWHLISPDGFRDEYACGIHLQRQINSFANDGLACIVTRLKGA